MQTAMDYCMSENAVLLRLRTKTFMGSVPRPPRTPRQNSNPETRHPKPQTPTPPPSPPTKPRQLGPRNPDPGSHIPIAEAWEVEFESLILECHTRIPTPRTQTSFIQGGWGGGNAFRGQQAFSGLCLKTHNRQFSACDLF